MSWQKHSFKMILGLPISLPLAAYAVNIGDTYVQSQQNQPLNATINVSDIDSASFSVKLADNAAYQQLGLSNSEDDKVNIAFEPTNSSGGKIVITSKEPIKAPFRDIVLDVTDKGETKTLPKTLLLPIDETKQSVTPSPIETQSNTQILDYPTIEEKKVILGDNRPLTLPVITENSPVTTNEPVETTTSPQPSNSLSATNNASEIPTIKDSLDKTKNLTISETLRPIYSANTQSDVYTPLRPNTSSADTVSTTATTSDVVTSEPPQNTATETTTTPNNNTNTAEATSDEASIVYVIQRNDNLWTIANQIAKQNKTDINKVMKEIVEINPNAFQNNDPSKILVNTELQIPKYQVIPSQLGVKAARELKKQAQPHTKKSHSSSTAHHKTTKASKPTKSTTKHQSVVAKGNANNHSAKAGIRQTSRPKKSHRNEMRIIAPSQSSGSIQGGANADKNVGSNRQASQIELQLQRKRQLTARQASRVGQLNQNLVSASQRIKLQNAKLAQLEQRLQELNKK